MNAANTIAVILCALFTMCLWGQSPDPMSIPPPPPPAAATSQPVVAPDPHALPEWLAKAIDTVEEVPIVGPYVSTAMKWVGLVAAVMTTVVTGLLGLILGLSSILKLAKLETWAASLQALTNGPVMYWLKFFSMYNAAKPTAVVAATSEGAKSA